MSAQNCTQWIKCGSESRRVCCLRRLQREQTFGTLSEVLEDDIRCSVLSLTIALSRLTAFYCRFFSTTVCAHLGFHKCEASSLNGYGYFVVLIFSRASAFEMT